MAQEVKKIIKGKTFVCIPSDVGDFDYDDMVDLFVEVGGKRELINSNLIPLQLEEAIELYFTEQEAAIQNEMKKEKNKKTIIDELKSKGWSQA